MAYGESDATDGHTNSWRIGDVSDGIAGYIPENHVHSFILLADRTNGVQLMLRCRVRPSVCVSVVCL